MYNEVLQFPEQFLQGWELAKEASFECKPRHVFFSALGGSALTADILHDSLILEDPVRILRNYELPDYATSEDVVICASYSGNTEEVLAVFEQAHTRKIPVIIIAHKGKLLEQAKAHDLPLITIPQCVQPRSGLGYFYAALLHLLYRMGRIPSFYTALLELRNFLHEEQMNFRRQAYRVSDFLRDHIPIIYGPSEFEGTCRNWKIKFNENCKTPAFYNVFPELNHNEMVGWERLSMQPACIMLESQFMHPRVKLRMEVFQEIFSKRLPLYSLALQGENRIQEIFSSLQIADFASLQLAEYYAVDPAQVPVIEDFKVKLGA